MRIPAYVHLLRAKDRIDRDYAQSLDMATLAGVAQASPAHFARSFKRAFGVTPGRYLRERRIERAKQLLRGGDSTVTEVCMAVGFSSLGSFSSAFAELVGEPPIEYQRRSEERRRAVPDCFSMMWTRPEVSSLGEASTRR